MVLVFAVLSLAAAGYVYATGTTSAQACSSVSIACVAGPQLSVGPTPSGPWYRESPPPLTDQILQVAGNLYPGCSGTMVACVKNVGSAVALPSIGVEDLVDRGGAWTEPERGLEPQHDRGDLSANIVCTITYTSSLRPGTTYTVARATLRDLAGSGRRLTAPVTLAPYSLRSHEIGTWKIAVSVPTAADNRIQGDWTSCTMRFGLAQRAR